MSAIDEARGMLANVFVFVRNLFIFKSSLPARLSFVCVRA